MKEERFKEILKEYGFNEEEAVILWENRPRDIEISEASVRIAAMLTSLQRLFGC